MMCGDCQRRFEVNPLRLLDCKNEPCQPFKADAPKSIDNLCEPCQTHFTTLLGLLTDLGIGYTDRSRPRARHRLLHAHSFRVRTQIEGSQTTIGAGGRYDGLIEQLGGRETPGVGFGSGMERIILNLKRLGIEPPGDKRPDAFVAIADAAAAGKAMALARELRAGTCRS